MELQGTIDFSRAIQPYTPSPKKDWFHPCCNRSLMNPNETQTRRPRDFCMKVMNISFVFLIIESEILEPTGGAKRRKNAWAG